MNGNELFRELLELKGTGYLCWQCKREHLFFTEQVCNFFCDQVYFDGRRKYCSVWKFLEFPFEDQHYPLYSCIPILAMNDFAFSLAAAPMEDLLFLALK